MTTKKRTVTGTPSIQVFLTLQRTLHKITNDIYSTLHTNNLTASQFSVLEALHRHGPMVQRDLAEQIMKTTGNITTVIDNLEKHGLVERIRGEKDRRYFEIVLTAEGSRLIKKFYPVHLKQVEKVIGLLTDEEKKELTRICGILEHVEE